MILGLPRPGNSDPTVPTSMSLHDAFTTLRSLRPSVGPNVGFMQQLVALELKSVATSSFDLGKYVVERTLSHFEAGSITSGELQACFESVDCNRNPLTLLPVARKWCLAKKQENQPAVAGSSDVASFTWRFCLKPLDSNISLGILEAPLLFGFQLVRTLCPIFLPPRFPQIQMTDRPALASVQCETGSSKRTSPRGLLTRLH
jgi:hypothetical protein